ncbi:MAG: hypothetical protein OEM46_01530 [Ignavibacteria bacterium]|nr:hypothetical protein [Ignavibacteria bacterium]
MIIAATVFILLCVIFLFAFFTSLRKKRFFGAVRNFTFAVLMLTLSLLFGTISISIQGYNALTREELAATVEIFPVSKQIFMARITFTDSSEKQFKLEGDEFYIDAHILKWKSLANLLGLHTFYELDRIAGRYTDIEDETNKNRTVYSVAEDKLIDAFDLCLKYPFLSFLVDAEYGSASFVTTNAHKNLKIMVSTTGLLIRDEEK